jgi:hypothetical protein
VKKVQGRDGKEHEVEEGVESVRTGVTVPYSPEFADLESNTTLLERLRAITGGQTYVDGEEELAQTARSGEVFRPGSARVKSLLPLWHWLVFLAGVLLLAEVALRRLALDFHELALAGERIWARLRGLPIPQRGREEFHERLQARKTQVRDTLEQTRVARRIEREAAPTLDVPIATEPAALPPPPTPPVPPESAREPDDFAERLRRAKKKALEDREKDKSE